MLTNLPAMLETWVQSLGQGDPLEEGMATHSSILAWRTPWTEEPSGHSPLARKALGTTEVTKHSAKKTRHLKGRSFIFSMYRKMQESGLVEITPLMCTSAIWGQSPVLSHTESLGVPCWVGLQWLGAWWHH